MRLFLLALSVSLMAGGAFALPSFSQVFTEPAGDIADLTLSTVQSCAVVAGVDTDGDGNQEIIYARFDGGSDQTLNGLAELYIYEYDGGDDAYALRYSDKFIADVNASDFSSFGDLIVADLDLADGPEIYLCYSGPGAGTVRNVAVYASSAENTWGVGYTVASDEYSGSALLANTDTEIEGVDIGDVDGDGTLEFVTADDEGPTNAVTVSSIVGGTWVLGTATFNIESVNINSPVAFGGSTYDTLCADMNADGQPDIVIGTYDFCGIGVWEASGPDTYPNPASVDNSPGPAPADELMKHNSMAAGDLDGDGIATLFFTDGREADIWTMQGVTTGNPVSTMATASQLLFDGGAQLTAAPVLVDPGTDSNGDLMAGQNLQLTDVDGNGQEELLFAIQPDHAGGSGGEIVIMEYSGSGADNAIGNYTVTRGAANNLTSVEYIGAVAAGGPQGPTSTFLDMDGDGHSEIVLAGPGAANAAIRVFESDTIVPVDLSVFETE
ncbi:hypothetical protein JXA47_11865 [Candidatus Sumerlaeota bacterium]|nr:hypothetical protein [Candidatus Sumerlaeota bacterium]